MAIPEKFYELRRRNRRLGYDMDRMKDSCKGLIYNCSLDQFTGLEVDLAASVYRRCKLIQDEILEVEAILLKLGDIYAQLIPTEAEMKKLSEEK